MRVVQLEAGQCVVEFHQSFVLRYLRELEITLNMSWENSENRPSSPSTPEWLERLHDDDRYEVEVEDTCGPILLVPEVGRAIIWHFCNELLGTQGHVGVAGQACHLLELHLAALLTKHMHMELSSVEWQTAKADLTQKLQLLITVCIQLATKMISSNNHLHVLTLKRMLQEQDLTYTVRDINKAELEVYKSINFRIPLWTNVEKAQMIAQALSNSTTLFDGVTLVMDIVEYHRWKVQGKVQNVAFEDPSPSTSRDSDTSASGSNDSTANLRTIYIVAGVVAATWHYFNEPGPDPLPRLATWMQTSETYIRCICNVIIEHVIDVNNNGTRRKRSSTQNSMESLRRKRQRLF